MPTLEISDETYEKIKNQLAEDEKINISCFEDMIGKKFFFRTVTYYMLGKVVSVFGNFLKLETASWIADTGRFHQAIVNGTLDEIEPVGEWFVNIQTVTDFGQWHHALPTEQK